MKLAHNVKGGVRLVFFHPECGSETSLFISDQDELKAKYYVKCSCGFDINMFFGSPAVGRKLLRRLKDMGSGPEDFFRTADAPSSN